METLANGVVYIEPHLLGEVVTRLKQNIPESLSVSLQQIFIGVITIAIYGNNIVVSYVYR